MLTKRNTAFYLIGLLTIGIFLLYLPVMADGIYDPSNYERNDEEIRSIDTPIELVSVIYGTLFIVISIFGFIILFRTSEAKLEAEFKNSSKEIAFFFPIITIISGIVLILKGEVIWSILFGFFMLLLGLLLEILYWKYQSFFRIDESA